MEVGFEPTLWRFNRPLPYQLGDSTFVVGRVGVEPTLSSSQGWRIATFLPSDG